MTALSVITQKLPKAKAGRAYNACVLTGGGTSPVTHVGGGTYLKLGSDGRISGSIPAGVSTDTVAGTGTDATGAPVSYSFVVTNVTTSGALSLAGYGTSYSASVGSAFMLKLPAPTTGSGHGIWKIVSQSGVNSFLLGPNCIDDGWLQAPILAAGVSTITVSYTDDLTATASITITVTADALLRMYGIDEGTHTGRLPDLMQGNAWSTTLAAAGGLNTGFTVSVISGALPAGITRSGLTLSGTPTTAGSGTAVLRASDGTNSAQADITFAWTVLPNQNQPRPAYHTGTGFYGVNGRLHDPNGAPHMIRGVNALITSNNSYLYTPLMGAPNTVRCCHYSGDALSGFLADINNYVGIDAFPILMTFGPGSAPVTGSTDPTRLGTAVDFWCTTAAPTILSAVNANGGVNIANEFGPTTSAWLDYYKPVTGQVKALSGTTLTISDTANPFNSNCLALKKIYLKGLGGVADQCVSITNATMGGSAGAWTFTLATAITGYTGGGVVHGGAVGMVRARGYTCPLWVDAGNFGQDYAVVLSYAEQINNADPLKSTFMDVHLYGNAINIEGRITGLTKGATTTITFTYPLAFETSKTTEVNPFGNTFINPLYIQGVSGMTAINDTIAQAGGYSGSAGAWQANNLAINSSSMAGTPSGGYIYGAGYPPLRAAQLAALTSRGVGVHCLEFGPAQPPMTGSPSPTWTTAAQVVKAFEDNLLGHCYWATDDGTGGANNSNLTDFAAAGVNSGGVSKAFYAGVGNATYSGLDRMWNPESGWGALAQPASVFVGGSGAVTPPGNPSGLTATPASNTRINLAWTASSAGTNPVASYNVQRAAASGGPYTTIANVASPTVAYSNTGLTASTTYYYRIQAVDSAGVVSSGFSSVQSATTASGADTTPPSVPGTPAVTGVSTSQTSLTWAASTDDVGVAGYPLQRCQGAGCVNFVTVATPTVPAYIDSGLIDSTIYRYQVAARDTAGNQSAFSPVGEGSTLVPSDTSTPTVPLNLTATAPAYNQTSLTWSAAIDNVATTGYHVGRCQGAGCTNFAVIDTVAVPAYIDAAVIEQSSYSYQVNAFDAAGNTSAYSLPATVVTPAKPAAPDFNVRVQDIQLELEEIERGALQLRWITNPISSPVTPFKQPWTFDDPNMTFDNPGYTFDGSSPTDVATSSAQALISGGYQPWTFDNPNMTFDNPNFYFDGLGPGTTFVTSTVWVNGVAVLETTGSEALLEGLLVDHDYVVYVTSGLSNAPPVCSKTFQYRYGSTEIGYLNKPPGPVPAPD